MTIRPLVEDDWPHVHEIVVEVTSAGQTYALDVPADEAETRQLWSAQHVVVAVDGDKVLGTAKAGPNRDAQGAHVGTASFMVSSSARGRGVGRLLGEHVVEWHRREDFRAIQFNAVVSTNVAAVTLWRRLGFVVVGTVPGAFALPEGGFADLHVMHLDLTDEAPLRVPDRSQQRERVLGVAARRFAELGWHGTTLDDVAVEAGVTVREVRRHARSKAELLFGSIGVTVLPPHTELQTALDELRLHEVPTVDERLDRVVALLCLIIGRLAPLLPALNEATASDPDAHAMLQGSDLRRLGTSRTLAGLLCRGEELPADAPALINVMTGAETYLGFARVGWPMERYAGWLRAALDHVVNGCRPERDDHTDTVAR